MSGVVMVLLVPEVVRLRQDRDGRLSGWSALDPEPEPAAAVGTGSG